MKKPQSMRALEASGPTAGRRWPGGSTTTKPYDELEFFPKFAAFSYWLRVHFAPSDQRWKSNVLARVIARMIGHPWLGQKVHVG